MKECRSCKIEKSADEFYKRCSNADGLYSYCKICTLEKNAIKTEEQKKAHRRKCREYNEKNKTVLLEKSREYYYKNREEQLKKRE